MTAIPVDDIEKVYSEVPIELRKVISGLLRSGRHSAEGEIVAMSEHTGDTPEGGANLNFMVHTTGESQLLNEALIVNAITAIQNRFGLDWVVAVMVDTLYSLDGPYTKQYVYDKFNAEVARRTKANQNGQQEGQRSDDEETE